MIAATATLNGQGKVEELCCPATGENIASAAASAVSLLAWHTQHLVVVEVKDADAEIYAKLGRPSCYFFPFRLQRRSRPGLTC